MHSSFVFLLISYLIIFYVISFLFPENFENKLSME